MRPATEAKYCSLIDFEQIDYLVGHFGEIFIFSTFSAKKIHNVGFWVFFRGDLYGENRKKILPKSIITFANVGIMFL